MRGSIVYVPDSVVKANRFTYILLSVLDTLISCAVITPAVVAYWHSVWELMDLYVYPDNPFLSSLISTLIGTFGHFFVTISQNFFIEYIHPEKNELCFYVVSKLYTICVAFICVNGWRGPWGFLILYASSNVWSEVATVIVALIALASMRVLRNCSAAPFSIAVDTAKGYFEVVTMFRTTMTEKMSLYILDCLFSIMVVGNLVVFVWKGCWVLLDTLVFPSNPILSSWGSLVIGYSAVAIAFLLQSPMRMICDRIKGAPRLIVADLFLIFSLFGTINIWRGIWNLLNIYLLPDDLPLSCWISHSFSYLLLVLLGCSNSLLVRGVYIDAEEPAGKCVVFPCYYLRLIFQEERKKKLQNLLQNVASTYKQDNNEFIANKNQNTSLENNHFITLNTVSEKVSENCKF